MQPLQKTPSDGLPLPGDVGPLEPDSTRFYKVCKHLLKRAECWHLVCPGLPRDPFLVALSAGCSAYVLQPGVNQFEHTPEGCRRHVLGAHDQHYEPAYRRALVSGAKSGHLEFLPKTRRQFAAAVGEQGVFVLLHRTSQTAWNVKTAYRVSSRRGPETHEAFFERALSYWQRKTSTPAEANTMSAEPTWTDVITRRLGALLDRIERQEVQSLKEDDAARALALLANAEQYPGSAPLGALLQRGLPHVGALAATARFEDAEHLLQELHTALEEGEEPHGILHDVLLDLDDWLSVSVFLERHGHPAPEGMAGPERHRTARRATERLARASDQLLPWPGGLSIAPEHCPRGSLGWRRPLPGAEGAVAGGGRPESRGAPPERAGNQAFRQRLPLASGGSRAARAPRAGDLLALAPPAAPCRPCEQPHRPWTRAEEAPSRGRCRPRAGRRAGPEDPDAPGQRAP